MLRSTSSCSAGEALFLNEELSDVVIVVRSTSLPWRFPAHSLLLSSQSPVFRRMLESDFSENSSKQIVIEDIPPTSIERLLWYIYHGEIMLENWKEGIDLLRASHKYQIDALVYMCGKFLENVISLSNVCYIYEEAMTYNLGTLKDKCLKLILDAGFVVLRSKTFEVLTRESVLQIITNSNLNVDSELTVFGALLHWAPMQCCRANKPVTEPNILLELRPFLPHVCFDDMSDTDKSALPSSILSCVKPNNRNRVLFSVTESLLKHTKDLSFASSPSISTPIGSGLMCMRFSIDSPVHLLAMSFSVMATDIPFLSLAFVKEGVSNCALFTSSITAVMWLQGIHANDRKYYYSQIVLRQPTRLEERTVYKIYCEDRGQNTQCLKCELKNKTLQVAHGRVHFSIHSEEAWGISNMKFL